MIYELLSRLLPKQSETLASKIYDEDKFYDAFLKDLGKCGSEVIIESPFITNRRVIQLMPTIKKLKSRKVRVAINTRNPEEHDNFLRSEAQSAIGLLQSEGVQVIFTEGHHRKLAILDRNILWEGSLNILSQKDSREMMRRTVSTVLSWQMVRFTKLDKLMN